MTPSPVPATPTSPSPMRTRRLLAARLLTDPDEYRRSAGTGVPVAHTPTSTPAGFTRSAHPVTSGSAPIPADPIPPRPPAPEPGRPHRFGRAVLLVVALASLVAAIILVTITFVADGSTGAALSPGSSPPTPAVSAVPPGGRPGEAATGVHPAVS